MTTALEEAAKKQVEATTALVEAMVKRIDDPDVIAKIDGRVDARIEAAMDTIVDRVGKRIVAALVEQYGPDVAKVIVEGA